jgi:hypothetical protein
MSEREREKERDARLGPLQQEQDNMVYSGNLVVSVGEKTTAISRNVEIICENKMPTRCNRCIFIADIIACSTCFGHHYAHHQELESIIHRILPVVFGT